MCHCDQEPCKAWLCCLAPESQCECRVESGWQRAGKYRNARFWVWIQLDRHQRDYTAEAAGY